jgi:hypothetical protein
MEKASGRSFARTTEKRPRTKDDDEDEEDGTDANNIGNVGLTSAAGLSPAFQRREHPMQLFIEHRYSLCYFALRSVERCLKRRLPSLDGPTATTRRRNDRPQRERLPCFKAGISIIKKIKPAVVTGTGERFHFAELQGLKGTEVSIEFDLHKNSVLAALLIDSKDFRGDGSHGWHFYV